ncbi:MAG: DUF4124 domain-containing protein [Zoogloeaceae bacterium]|jgi:hypothetical protein|nr:DUF4124 domain-containing protein [Zoogloeaceae bacterium]
MNRILFFVALAASLNAGAVAAQAYKCVENGKTTISTAPCPAGAVTRAEIVAENLPDAEAARADVERQQRYLDNMARDAAHAAEQKMKAEKIKAEQAALEARAQRDEAEAEALRANADRSAIFYYTPPYGFYGYGKYGGDIRGYGVFRNNSRPDLSIRIQAGSSGALVRKGSASVQGKPSRRGSAGQGGHQGRHPRP